MLEPEFGRALGLMLGELGEIIMETLRGAAIEPRPKSGFTNSHATRGCHVDIIIGRAADHMSMRLDVAHAGIYLRPGQAPAAALVVAAGIASVVGSLRESSTRFAAFGSILSSSLSAVRKAARRKS